MPTKTNTTKVFHLCALAVFCFVIFGIRNAQAQPTWTAINAETPITMTVNTPSGNAVITATLDASNPTARDFIATLPRTMDMTRWDDREYYGKVGHPLADAGPQQSGYADGDVTYYVPGGSYAVFFAKGGRSPISNLVVMGKVTSDLKVFDTLGKTVKMHIQVAEE